MSVKKYTGTDKAFLAACEKAGIPATHRQYKKWENKKGKAFAAKDN